MKKSLIALIAFCMLGFGTAIQAQNTITATGGNATGSGGSVSYTTGQIVYTTNTGASGSVAQGVQQPYEISVITEIKEARDISLEIGVYPNPATDYLMLKTGNYEVKNLRYHLYDINGILLLSDKVTGSETTIVMSNLLSGTYILKVTEKNRSVKIFKIIKY